MSRRQLGPDPLGGAEWARHSQEEWHRRAGDSHLPRWLRVAALAYGSHGNNGHATFKRGDMAVTLGLPGEPLDRRRLHEHIALAVEFGWLEPGSTSMCLIVPSGQIDKGTIGAPKARCPIHDRRKRRHAQPSGSHPDGMAKASGSDPDSSGQLSRSHPDASRSCLLSSPNPHPEAVQDPTTTDRTIHEAWRSA